MMLSWLSGTSAVSLLFYKKKECEKMRYCSNCGSVLPDNDVSFCLICKKEVKGVQEPIKKKKKGKIGKKTPKNDNQIKVGIGYGSYYDDIVPEDAERVHEKKRKDNLGIKIGLLGFAVVLIVATCIIVAFML